MLTLKKSPLSMCSAFFCAGLWVAFTSSQTLLGQEVVESVDAKTEIKLKDLQLPKLGKDWKRLSQENSPERLWINNKTKQVAIDGTVCLTRGYLEMFACSANTKEHESVVALDARPQLIHLALLAVGAEHGSPSSWRPYKPATGDVIKVYVEYMDDTKPRRDEAQLWVRDVKTKKPMEQEWVFAGSSWVVDPETKKRYYRADGGEVICVSNFPVAMMDLPIESSQANDDLAFEAFTENIPKRRTPVRVYLVPPKKKAEEQKSTDKKKPGETPKTKSAP